MRALLVVLALAGCDEHGKSPAHVDGGPTTDANLMSCTSLAGTADVAVGTARFSRLDAGGVLLGGGGVAANGIPMSLDMLVTNAPALSAGDVSCCRSSDTTCCHSDGLVVHVDMLPAGGELGAHAATFKRATTPAFTAAGSVTITQFVQPFDQPPGRIAGSLAGDSGISGTFDNAFCEIMLSVPI